MRGGDTGATSGRAGAGEILRQVKLLRQPELARRDRGREPVPDASARPGSLDRVCVCAVLGATGPDPVEAVSLGHPCAQNRLESPPVPTMPAGLGPDVEMDELVEQGLQGVAGPDSRVRGDREPPLLRDREPEPVRPAGGTSNLELGPADRQLAAGEGRQAPEPLHLLGEVEPGDAVVAGSTTRWCPTASHRRGKVGPRAAANRA
jgi:hypothetical protein